MEYIWTTYNLIKYMGRLHNELDRILRCCVPRENINDVILPAQCGDIVCLVI